MPLFKRKKEKSDLGEVVDPSASTPPTPGKPPLTNHRQSKSTTPNNTNGTKKGGFLRRGSKKATTTTSAAAAASSASSVSSAGSKGSRRNNNNNKKTAQDKKKKQKHQAPEPPKHQVQPGHPEAILSSADSSVSSAASSLGHHHHNTNNNNKTPPRGTTPPPPTELQTIDSVVDPSSSWDHGGDDSSHNDQSSTGGLSTSSTGYGASNNPHAMHPYNKANSFKKESLRRSCSTGSNPKMLSHSTSAIGLDEMIEDRRVGGDLGQNVVHIEVPFGKPIEEVYDGVHNGPVLGSGIAGMVRLVTHKATGLKYAVKVLDLGLVETPTGLQQLREEIFIMCQLDHPNIVRLEEVYESHTEIYLVQELCLGGELFDRLDEQPDYHYTEAECARLVKQMLSAVRYLHSKGIIHRDLKLENFLFSSVHPDSELKMIDFGLSKHFRYGEVHHEAVGTPYTVAPEVIRGTYDERCDIWAIGVISFLLLSGEPPFGGCGGPEPLMTVRGNILQGRYAFEPAEIWELVSTRALSFIRSLLVTDPKARPTAQQAQQHEWFQEWEPRQNGNNALSANVVKALVNFKEFSDMRKLLCEVLSFTLLPDQIRDLRREFEKMDTDGSGEISLTALKQVLMQNAGAGSLGALTEEEVTDIFDAMRVRKTETRIHWHEFIAAGLSQCSVDDRNLRLAFERLDSDHKGYIILDDIMDLMGSDALQSEDAMRQMWGDSIKAVKCQHARITYDDFLLLMKGQTRENPTDHLQQRAKVGMDASLVTLGASLTSLQAVPESRTLENFAPEATAAMTAITQESTEHSDLFGPSGPMLSQSAPVTPADHKKLIDIDGEDFGEDSPLSMDDALPAASSLTPPMTPERGPSDYLSPRNAQDRVILPPSGGALPSNPLFIPSFPVGQPYVRRRSRSLGEHGDEDEEARKDDSERSKDPSVARIAEEPNEAVGDLHAVADAVRDLILPEADHGAHVPPDLEEVVKDKTKSALVVNRRLYRAHRQMRLAVLEASKRFEEQQAEHARDVILAQREQNQEQNGGGASAVIHAGLVMRHGHTKQVSSEAIRAMLARDRAEQQTLVEIATRRGGRGRRSRKKTISDMSGMLSSTEEFNNTPVASPIPSSSGHRPSRNSLGGSIVKEVSAERETSGLMIEDMEEPMAGPGSFLPPNPPPLISGGPQQSSNSVPPATASVDADSRIGGMDTTVMSSASPSAAAAKEGTMRSATVPGDFKKTSDPFGSQGKYGATMSKWQT